jgi:hypothetical protein
MQETVVNKKSTCIHRQARASGEEHLFHKRSCAHVVSSNTLLHLRTCTHTSVSCTHTSVSCNMLLHPRISRPCLHLSIQPLRSVRVRCTRARVACVRLTGVLPHSHTEMCMYGHWLASGCEETMTRFKQRTCGRRCMGSCPVRLSGYLAPPYCLPYCLANAATWPSFCLTNLPC